MTDALGREVNLEILQVCRQTNRTTPLLFLVRGYKQTWL